METYSDGDIENEREERFEVTSNGWYDAEGTWVPSDDEEDGLTTPCPYPEGECLIHGEEWGEAQAAEFEPSDQREVEN